MPRSVRMRSAASLAARCWASDLNRSISARRLMIIGPTLESLLLRHGMEIDAKVGADALSRLVGRALLGVRSEPVDLGAAADDHRPNARKPTSAPWYGNRCQGRCGCAQPPRWPRAAGRPI